MKWNTFLPYCLCIKYIITLLLYLMAFILIFFIIVIINGNLDKTNIIFLN